MSRMLLIVFSISLTALAKPSSPTGPCLDDKFLDREVGECRTLDFMGAGRVDDGKGNEYFFLRKNGKYIFFFNKPDSRIHMNSEGEVWVTSYNNREHGKFKIDGGARIDSETTQTVYEASRAWGVLANDAGILGAVKADPHGSPEVIGRITQKVRAEYGALVQHLLQLKSDGARTPREGEFVVRQIEKLLLTTQDQGIL